MFKIRFLLVNYVRLFFTVLCIVFGVCNSYSQANSWNNKQIDSVLNSVNKYLIDSPDNAFKVSKKVHEIALKKKYSLGCAYALLNMANCRGELRDYDEALNYLAQSRQIAEKISNDSLLLYNDFLVTIQKGRIGLNEMAVNDLDACLERASCLQGDSKAQFLGRLYSFKAFFSGNIKKKPTEEQFIALHRKAAYYFSKTKRAPNIGLVNIGDTYLSSGKLDSAEFYFKKALVDFKKKKVSSGEIVLSNLAEVYYKKKDYRRAFAYLENSTVLAKQKRIYYILEYNYGLYKKIFEQKGVNHAVLAYQKLELIYKDSVQIAEQKSMIGATNYISSKAEGEKIILKNRSVFLLIVASLFIISLLMYVYWQFCYKNKLKFETQQKKKIIEQNAIQIVSLKQKVTTSYDEVIEMAKMNDPLFVNSFKELYPDFYSKLIDLQPSLTIIELKICFYLKLKFSTKEIAEYTFVTAKAIQNRKSRLRKRFLLKDGEDIYNYFN